MVLDGGVNLLSDATAMTSASGWGVGHSTMLAAGKILWQAHQGQVLMLGQGLTHEPLAILRIRMRRRSA